MTTNIHAVVGILKRDQYVLIAQRPPNKPYSGYWEFPGGKIEPSETSQEALNRELYEELGINVLAPKFLFSHQHNYPDKQVNLDIWLIEKFVGEPQSQENQMLRWVQPFEIVNFKLLEGNWPLLKKLEKLL